MGAGAMKGKQVDHGADQKADMDEWLQKALTDHSPEQLKEALAHLSTEGKEKLAAAFGNTGGKEGMKDKVILITGATSGLGAATARLLAKQGAKVVCTGRREDKGKAVVDEIVKAGGTALFVQADVTKEEDCKKMVDEAVAKYGKLDGAFNNAGAAGPAIGQKLEDGTMKYGIEAIKPVGDYSSWTWKQVTDNLLDGVWRCCKYELKAMEKNNDGKGGGSILNCSSIYGLRANDAGVADYCAAKHGVAGLTKAIALEYAGKNIRCNSIHPGFVSSEMTSVYYDIPAFNGFIAMNQPLGGGRWGLDSEIASGVSYCLSDDSTWYTGQQLVLDGGLVTQHFPQHVTGAIAGLLPHVPDLKVVTPPKASDGKVAGKVIIVTGATSGLGKAAAMMLAKGGASVVLSGRREENGKKVVEEITAAGGTAHFVKCDVTKEEDCKKLVDETVQKYGKLDGAFNNAGVSEAAIGRKDEATGEMKEGVAAMAPVADMTYDCWNGVMNANLHGVFYCCKYQIQAMEKNGGGSIVICSSIYGKRGTNIGVGGYIASKHAVVGLSKSIAMEYAVKGIRCNTVHPGFVNSEMTSLYHDVPAYNKLTALGQPLDGGRWGLDSEIAAGVTHLLSDESSWSTGTELLIDGGTCATWLPKTGTDSLQAASAAAEAAAKAEAPAA